MKKTAMRKSRGSNAILSIGIVLSGLMAAPFAVDIPTYYAVQQQMQTAVDAAALAGALKLPYSQAQAEQAAYEVAALNPVMGKSLKQSDLTFNYDGANMRVTGKTQVPTVTAKLLCALSFTVQEEPDPNAPPPDPNAPEVHVLNNCDSLDVGASAQAAPAARDTVLVIDTSNSMDDLGGGQPFKDVKSSATAFLNLIDSMNSSSVDRVALVKFNTTGSLQSTFVSKAQSPGFSSLKSKITAMTLYSGSGWNTNYEAGLKKALDEIQANGRPLAHKNIIFFTDGKPNLPGPSSPSINTCVTYKNKGQNTSAKTCATTYTNYMINQTNTQILRAKALDVTIHTIEINDPDVGASLPLLQSLLMNPTWEPGLLDAMATTTEGEQFNAEATDGPAIMAIFQEVAKLIKVKLSA